MQNPRVSGRLSIFLRFRVPCLLLLFLALTWLPGCSTNKAGEEGVSGKVTLDGQPVTGEIVFVYPDNKQVASPIFADGTYTIGKPEPGTVKVVVRPLGGVPPPEAKAIPKEASAVVGAGGGTLPPAKYGSADTTPLTYEVKGGGRKDFQLEK